MTNGSPTIRATIDDTGLAVTGSTTITNTSNGAETDALIVKNYAAGANTATALKFFPTQSTTRFASIVAENVDGNNNIALSFLTAAGNTPAVALTLNQDKSAVFTDNITAFSDRRLKDNIETLDGTKTYEMRGVSYTRDGRPGSGVIAQELEEVAPELVLTNDEGIKSGDYGRTIGYLIETIKHLNQRLTKTELLLEESLKQNKNNP